MEQEILNKLQQQEVLLQKVYESSEKMRKYFMWTLYITLALFVIPLIGLMFVVPFFLSTMSSTIGL